MRPQILMVDDEQNVLSAYRRNLRGEFNVEAATGTVAGLHTLKSKGPFEVVVSDLRMPGIDGTRFLARVREIAPETIRIMLTGYADADTAIQAVNEGHVFRILTKPCPPETLRKALRDGTRQFRLITGERELLEETLAGCVKLLTEMLRLTDPQAFGRLSRVQKLVRLLLPRYGRERAWELDVTAMLSETGLMALPPEIRRKTSQGQPLTPGERKLFASHPKIGQDLLRNISRLEGVARNVAFQLKHFDGSGIPETDLSGEEIPFAARLLFLLQDYDELVTSGLPCERALATMEMRTGYYDPELLADLKSAVVKEHDGCTFQLLSAGQLRSGMVVPDGISTVPGRLLMGKEEVLTSSSLAKVRNFANWQEISEPIGVLVPVANSEAESAP